MIEFITMSFFVFSSVYGGATINDTNTNMVLSASTTVESIIEEQAINIISTRKELEQKAKLYFKDDPILVDIARCESSFRHLDKDGEILRGKVNKSDLGLMQINEYYHADKATVLGLDLKTIEGNMAYAQYLYDREGSKPWNSSSKCWKQAVNSEIVNKQIAINN